MISSFAGIGTRVFEYLPTLYYYINTYKVFEGICLLLLQRFKKIINAAPLTDALTAALQS